MYTYKDLMEEDIKKCIETILSIISFSIQAGVHYIDVELSRIDTLSLVIMKRYFHVEQQETFDISTSHFYPKPHYESKELYKSVNKLCTFIKDNTFRIEVIRDNIQLKKIKNNFIE